MSSSAPPSDCDASSQHEDTSWKDWEASGDEAEEPAAQSLFSNERFFTAEDAMQHDAETFDFDLLGFIARGNLGEYDIIKVINYIRTQVSHGNDVLSELKATAIHEQQPWNSDQFLIPVKGDDPFLFHDFGEAMKKRLPHYSKMETSCGGDETADPEEVKYLRQQNQALMQEVKLLKADSATRVALLTALDENSDEPERRDPSNPSKEAPGSLGNRSDAVMRNIDRNYFDSYSQYEIHHEMLSDKVRTEAYQNALEKNPSLIRNKIVLDVGCGTGILSLFACRGGAAKVVAVDGSKWVAEKAKKIASKNGYLEEQGGSMSVLSGKFEDMDLNLNKKVDVIVSEWMGYALLFESMLDTVLVARDQCLREGGAVLPDLIKMKLAGACEEATGLQFWKDVYGFDMAPIRDEVLWKAARRPMVQPVDQKFIVTNTIDVKELDLMAITPADANFHIDFEVNPLKAEIESTCHAFVMWFDALFTTRFCKEHPVTLSTSPFEPQTHWNQTVLTLKNPVVLGGSNGAVGIKCRLSMSQGDSHRSLDLAIEYIPQYESGPGDKDVVLYIMAIGQKV